MIWHPSLTPPSKEEEGKSSSFPSLCGSSCTATLLQTKHKIYSYGTHTPEFDLVIPLFFHKAEGFLAFYVLLLLGGDDQKVMRERMDWFEGKFIVHSAPMEVRRKGKILSNKEWESLKSLGVRGEKLPRAMIAFLDAKKKEFSIFERSNRHGKREWELQDVDGSSKKLDLSSTVKNDPMGPVHGGWSYTEKYIDDGKLTTWRSLIHPKGKEIRGPKTIVAWWHCHPESFCASGKFFA